MPNPAEDADIALQLRCIYCGAKQYAPAVMDVSHGKHCCCWCGKTPPVLTTDEYRKAHQERIVRGGGQHAQRG